MLCKAENRDPEHCLKEGRRVTRCAQDLCVSTSGHRWPTAEFYYLLNLPLRLQYLEDAGELLEGLSSSLELPGAE